VLIKITPYNNMTSITMKAKNANHVLPAAARMIEKYETLATCKEDIEAGMHAEVTAWIMEKRRDGRTDGTISVYLSHLKKYLQDCERTDVAVHMVNRPLRQGVLDVREVKLDDDRRSKVDVDLQPYIMRAVSVLENFTDQFKNDTVRDNYLCRKYAALIQVLALRPIELFLLTTLTECAGDPTFVMADRVAKGGSVGDAEGCKTGPFKLKIMYTNSDVVLKNYTLVRAALPCQTVAEYITVARRARKQLRDMQPELVQLYKDKPGSRPFSLRACRHIKEAVCAALYCPKGTARDLYRQELFFHADVDVGRHYERFDHVPGAPLPTFQGMPEVNYDDSDDEDDTDDEEKDEGDTDVDASAHGTDYLASVTAEIDMENRQEAELKDKLKQCQKRKAEREIVKQIIPYVTGPDHLKDDFINHIMKWRRTE
jgi:hypothetical protein